MAISTSNKAAALLLSMGSGLLGGNLYANTIDALGIGPDTGEADVTCNGPVDLACSGFLGDPATLDWSEATAYPKQGNPDSELAYLNLLLQDIGAAPVSSVDKTDVEGNSFTTTREYFSIKKATYLWFFRNETGGALEVTWGQEAYSHWTEYGDEVVDAPEPSSLALLAMGWVGLLLTRSRRRA